MNEKLFKFLNEYTTIKMIILSLLLKNKKMKQIIAQLLDFLKGSKFLLKSTETV